MFKEKGKDFLNHSCHAMAQFDAEAACMEATAKKVEMQLIADAGVKAGAFKSFSVGYTQARGCVIQVMTDQGWEPEPFWVERGAGVVSTQGAASTEPHNQPR